MTPAIHTEGLTKHYGSVQALVDLSIDIGPGEVFGFLGPNGAGKTTMIRTILDEIRPTAGRAELLGMDAHAESVALRRRLGYLPGDLSLYPNLTGRDLVTYFGNLRGGVDWAVVGTIAERLDADLDRKIGDLSSGNRQKVGIIQAFMGTPDLLILDEPSTGLDPLVQREFQLMMREAAESGRTVFLSSHTLSEVQRVADRVGIIRHGHLIALEAVSDLRRKAIRRVELEFAARVAPYVKERRWHASQKIKAQPDGALRLSLRVCDDWSLRSWILGFGPFVRVLSPSKLAEEILDELEEARTLYAPRMEFEIPTAMFDDQPGLPFRKPS